MRSVIRLAAVLAAAAALYRLVVLPYRGNLVLQAVVESSAIAQKTSPQIAVIMARSNVAELERIAAGRRLDPAWYMLYGANCEMLERLPAAENAYTGALRVDDRPELYVNRAMIRLHLGQTDAAIADFVYAARFNPAVLQQIDGELRARVDAAMP